MSVTMVFKYNYAIISYHSINAIAGYSIIDMFTAVLKKNESATWKVDSYYYDPNLSW